MSVPSDVEDDGKRVVEDVAKSAVEFVGDRPLTAVAIAAALGFILAQVIF